MTINIDPAVAAMTAVMAGGLIWLGWKQIGALRQQVEQARNEVRRLEESSVKAEKSSRGELILRLNTVYGDMIDARRDAWDLHKKCKRQHPTNGAQFRRAFADELGQLRTSQDEAGTKRYYKLRALLDFGELVGFLVIERKILALDDIKGLWGTALRAWADWFEGHIIDLQKDYKDAYIFFLKLAKEL